MKNSAPLTALAVMAIALLAIAPSAEAQCNNCNNGTNRSACNNCGNCQNCNGCATGKCSKGRCAGGRCYSGSHGRGGVLGHRHGNGYANGYGNGYGNGGVRMKAQFSYGYYRHAHPYGPTIMDHIAYNRASGYNWHGNYNYTQWGVPVALVVPPTAEKHTEMGWGVAETRVYRNDHQFHPEYPGGAYLGEGGYVGGGGYPMFRNTPLQPSDTTQFGVYPVRAPWN